MPHRHRLVTFLLRPSRKSIAPAGDPAKPPAATELPAIHHFPRSPKNADRVAATQRGSGLEHTELPRKGGAIFPRWPAMTHRGDRVSHGPRRHFPALTIPRIRDNGSSIRP